jgi:hypothetical protein
MFLYISTRLHGQDGHLHTIWLIMKMTAFWDILKCSLVEVDQHFRSVYYPDDGGSTHL